MKHNERLNIDIILAGNADEKSSELLSNGRYLDILSYGKHNYDYVVIDTPAVNVASDTLILANYQADLFLYVIRANFLTERMLNIPKELYKNKRLPNMNILLNNTNYKKMGYDNSYDYGKANLKKSWWGRIF
jgi:Mrp family chromosome partitioning ATPase